MHQTSLSAKYAKRALDFSASLLGLALLAPLFALLAILVKHDSPGPVFYHGTRLGRGGKPFFVHKFRSMHESIESYLGARLTAQDDPRITRFGHWLRDSKLNELPQFWNVLVGEMSLVGPRPEDPEICSKWPEEARKEVLSVCPGLTSPASLHFYNEEQLLRAGNVMQTYVDSILPVKLRLDQDYVRKRCFRVDLEVLVSTFLTVTSNLLQAKGRRIYNLYAPSSGQVEPQAEPGEVFEGSDVMRGRSPA